MKPLARSPEQPNRIEPAVQPTGWESVRELIAASPLSGNERGATMRSGSAQLTFARRAFMLLAGAFDPVFVFVAIVR